GRLDRDRPAEQTARGRGPERDVVLLLRACGDDRPVRAEADERKPGIVRSGRLRVRQYPPLLPGGDVPALDAGLPTGAIEGPSGGAEVDPVPAALTGSQRPPDGSPRPRAPEGRPCRRGRREKPAVRAEGCGLDRRVEPLQPRSDPRCVLQRTEESAAG